MKKGLKKMTWWKKSTAYQIYPKSFKDSNNDGMGDIQGIISKLDYLQELGVDLLWISPIYQSPMKDNGYDVSDYYAIDETYGTMADFEELLQKAHEKDIRIVMDLVINHSSNKHPWFIASSKSKDNPYRDYYYWRDGKNGKEPNNWAGYFHESAWTYDSTTDQYYLGVFSPYQPDLNWENPEVRRELYQMINWWLDKGLDGFRLDAINLISKVSGLPDNEQQEGQRYVFDHRQFVDGPRVHEFFRELNQNTFAKYDCVAIGECGYVNPNKAVLFTTPENGELDMVFTFEHTDYYKEKGKNPKKLKEIIAQWQKELHNKGWSGICFSNHDLPRIVTLFGHEGQFRRASAKLFATLLLSLEGTPFIYQGDELGLPDTRYESIHNYDDLSAKKLHRERKRQGLSEEETMKEVQIFARDRSRSPMHWDSSLYLGFSSVQPWIKPNEKCRSINCSDSMKNEESVLTYYKKMIKIRKEQNALVFGDFELLPSTDEIFAYRRFDDQNEFIVILNISEKEQIFQHTLLEECHLKTLITNYPAESKRQNAQILQPYQSMIFQVYK